VGIDEIELRHLASQRYDFLPVVLGVKRMMSEAWDGECRERQNQNGLFH
jgi:hypothetical protein